MKYSKYKKEAYLTLDGVTVLLNASVVLSRTGPKIIIMDTGSGETMSIGASIFKDMLDLLSETATENLNYGTKNRPLCWNSKSQSYTV